MILCFKSMKKVRIMTMIRMPLAAKSQDSPKRRYANVSRAAVRNSTSGYCRGIFVLQSLHLPLKIR